MVKMNAISCVYDYVSGCLHKSTVVHERRKRNQTQMACYIDFSGKGQTNGGKSGGKWVELQLFQ
jgi:hypothetical protein